MRAVAYLIIDRSVTRAKRQSLLDGRAKRAITSYLGTTKNKFRLCECAYDRATKRLD